MSKTEEYFINSIPTLSSLEITKAAVAYNDQIQDWPKNEAKGHNYKMEDYTVF